MAALLREAVQGMALLSEPAAQRSRAWQGAVGRPRCRKRKHRHIAGSAWRDRGARLAAVMSRSALNVAVAIGALHLHPSPDAAFDSSARVPADSPVREVSVLAAPVELLARTSRAAVVSALGRLKLAIGGRRGGWSPTAAAAVPPPKTARFRLQAVKDVAVSGRFVHQWELLREAIAALAAECLVSLPNDVGDGDGESSPAAKPDGLAPVDALRADIQVTKDSTQDGVAPADVVPLIQSLPAAPFTLQRLCEVVSARGGGVYKSRPKLAYALHRLASVTSTLQPVAVEDRWAQGSGGGLGGEGSDMAGALRLRRPLGEDTDEQADGSELSAAAAPAAGARTVSAKRPREGDDAD
ncbi:unnamed protein product, partial [Symbiodinium sp. KB8]